MIPAVDQMSFFNEQGKNLFTCGIHRTRWDNSGVCVGLYKHQQNSDTTSLGLSCFCQTEEQNAVQNEKENETAKTE
jgi:phenylpropionate dioxygenase-like ring-hydroxylating dioxygenase large terminal subunit